MAGEEDSPRTGVGILAGQWGTFETTLALDMSVDVMTGEMFAGKYRVKRRGALYLPKRVPAVSSIASTMSPAAREHQTSCPLLGGKDCPPLTDRRTADTLMKHVAEAADYFQAEYDLPIAVIWLDTWI